LGGIRAIDGGLQHREAKDCVTHFLEEKQSLHRGLIPMKLLSAIER